MLSFSIGSSSILGVGGGKEEVEFSQEPRELLAPPASLLRHDGVLSRPGHARQEICEGERGRTEKEGQ